MTIFDKCFKKNFIFSNFLLFVQKHMSRFVLNYKTQYKNGRALDN